MKPEEFQELVKPKRRAVQHEARSQRQLFAWAKHAVGMHPELRWLFAVPNGGSRHIREAALMVAEGVKRGVPDVFLDVARGEFHGLRIEMKSEKGRLRPEQILWREHYIANGYCWQLCRTFEEAQIVILTYLNL